MKFKIVHSISTGTARFFQELVQLATRSLLHELRQSLTEEGAKLMAKFDDKMNELQGALDETQKDVSRMKDTLASVKQQNTDLAAQLADLKNNSGELTATQEAKVNSLIDQAKGIDQTIEDADPEPAPVVQPDPPDGDGTTTG